LRGWVLTSISVLDGRCDAAIAAKSGIPTFAKPMTLWFDLLPPGEPHHCIRQLQNIHFSGRQSRRYNFTHAV
jgi:hypothetical protein